MEPNPWEQKEVPWCMIGLVLAILSCLVCLLIGNLDTAGALSGMGESSDSWSDVALELGKALNHEIDWLMGEVDKYFGKSLNQSAHIQELIDTFLALTGNMTDTMAKSNTTKAACSLLQSQSFHHAIEIGHAHHGPVSAISGIVLGTVDQVIDQLMIQLLASLDQLMATLKPALEHVGTLMVKFGDNAQATLQSFSATLDTAQKMFDQIMSGMSHKVENSDELLNATFSLFDLTSTGAIGAEDITLVAQACKISALDGAKSLRLVKKYDNDGSGKLNKKEFAEMAEDPSIPDILAVTLRSFAMRLSEVSGLLAHAKSRDDAVHGLVTYLQLTGATNMTQVDWISDRLTNASMPKQFTVDVMVDLALQEDNPNALKTSEIGQVILSSMMSLNPAYTLTCYEQLLDPDYWHSEGYDPTDYSVVVERLTKWIAKGSQDSATLWLETSLEGEAVAAEKPPVVWIERALLNAMPLFAKKHAAKRMEAHVMIRQAEKHAHYNELYASKTSQTLLLHLLGGVHAADTSSTSSKAARAILRGLAATPAILEFAHFLSWNASQIAKRFQGYCFDQTQQSSNAIDGFAMKIQGMAKKMQLFMKQMQKHATPAAVEELEEKVEFFAAHGLQDISQAVRKGLDEILHATSPRTDASVYSELPPASNLKRQRLEHSQLDPTALHFNHSGRPAQQFGEAAQLADKAMQLATAVGERDRSRHQALHSEMLQLQQNLYESRLISVMTAASSCRNASRCPLKNVSITPPWKDMSSWKDLAKVLPTSTDQAASGAASVAKVIPTSTDQAASGAASVAKVIPTSTGKAASGAASVASRISSARDLLKPPQLGDSDGKDADATDAFSTITQLLRTLENYLPMAKDKLKWARRELSGLEGMMDSAFAIFGQKAPPTFDRIAHIWRWVWLLYFCVMTPLVFLMLFYSFWAGGYFGGPGAAPKQDEPEMTPELTPEMTPETEEEKPSVFMKLSACCHSLCDRLRDAHDSNICFWFVFVIFQIFVMTLFLISMAFATLATVKAFVGSGCGVFYALRDGQICGDTLLKLQGILSMFMKNTPLDAVPGVCDEKQMLICHMVGEKMKWSAILTSVGSFFAAILGFQMLVECEILHTRAAERRRLVLEHADKK